MECDCKLSDNLCGFTGKFCLNEESCPIAMLGEKVENLFTNYTHDRNLIMQRLKEVERWMEEHDNLYTTGGE